MFLKDIFCFFKNIFTISIRIWYYYVSFILYVSFIIFILYTINFISFQNSKDILYWAFSALVLSMSVFTYEKTVSKIKGELLSISLIIEYVLNFYIFPLPIEFIIVTLSSFVLIFYYLNKKDRAKNNSNVVIRANIVFIFILTIIIGIKIIFSIIEISKEFNIGFIILNLKNIFIPIILTILYAPFLLFFRFFENYQKKLIRKRFANKNNLD